MLRAAKFVTDETQKAMRRPDEYQATGTFATNWIKENSYWPPVIQQDQVAEQDLDQIEQVGAQLRGMVPFSTRLRSSPVNRDSRDKTKIDNE